MSKVLGPIHYMMYEKIKFQDEITEYLLSGSDDFENMNKIMPPVSRDELSKLIDNPNIHGWLSAKIDIVESRLSYAIKKVDDACEKMYEFGKSKSLKKRYHSCEEIFEDINKLILDGMPCDGALNAKIDDEGNLYLIQNIDLHKEYQENPLMTDPSLSLSKTCDGDHDHDHHESFEVEKLTEISKENLDSSEISKFHRCRLYLLKGFLYESGYDVDMINSTDYRIFEK
ncbi:MAG: hypothetical protein Q4P34_07705 [Tissierellia bacterium]|nr:hypothetical protein [Tissierellia bacterium]